ncbi:unnamed protein product [Urochloa humidicola]
MQRVSETSNTTRSVIIPTRGTRGPKRVLAEPIQQGLDARMTRKRTSEQSSEEGSNGTSTNEEVDVFNFAPAAPAFPAQVEFLFLSMSCYVHCVLYLERTYVYVLSLYERERAQRIIRNNQMLQSLGIPALLLF